jgi:hypothetical protein
LATIDGSSDMPLIPRVGRSGLLTHTATEVFRCRCG